MGKSQVDTAVPDPGKGKVQQRIHRLHSLLFGADAASTRGDAETALGLGLRLLGFLESECQTAEDVTYIEPIKRQVLEKIAAASLETQVDRCVYFSHMSVRHCTSQLDASEAIEPGACILTRQTRGVLAVERTSLSASLKS